MTIHPDTLNPASSDNTLSCLLTNSDTASVHFVMPAIGQPRWSKRISMLKSEGFRVKAFAFERDYHRGRLPECEVHMLGAVTAGQYFKRLKVLVKAIPTLRKETRHADAIYAFGLDLALLVIVSNVFRNKPVIFEVGDIRPIQVAKGIGGRVMKYLSQKIYNRSSLLVVTAEEFVTGYYGDQNASETPYQVIENKLDKRVHDVNDTPSELSDSGEESDHAISRSLRIESSSKAVHAYADTSGNSLTIGYFGLLRSPWSFQTLARYAKDNPDTIKIFLAGALHEGKTEFDQLIALENVKYFGSYKSPDDLPTLYAQVDLVWGCYPEPHTAHKVDNSAWLWAQAVCRSNRFYESCYYQIPIASIGTSSDGKVVTQYGLGPVFETHNYDAIAKQLDDVTPQQLAIWRFNLSKLPASVYSYTEESATLAKNVRQLIVASH